ncbi:MAG: hypothetical protein COA66_13170 [Arcobacter sp.]|nr:MAG: hypothetical protein COA66_13170 [Arcobacter sp.]
MHFFKSIFFKVIVATFVLYALGGFFALPYYLEQNLTRILKENIDSKASVSKIYINPFLFELNVKNLNIKDKNDNTLLSFKNVDVDVDPILLFKRMISFKYIHIDELKINTNINKNEILNFQYILDFLNKNDKETKEENKSNDSFIETIEINSFELLNTYFTFKDISKKEIFEIKTQSFDIKANNISTEKNHVNELNFLISDKDTLSLGLSSTFSIIPLNFRGNIAIENVNINKVLKYVNEDAAFNISTNDFDVNLNYEYKIEDEIQKIKLDNLQLDIEVFDFSDASQKISANKIKNRIDYFNIDIDKNKNIKYFLDNKTMFFENIKYEDLTKKHIIKLKSLSAKIKKLDEDKSKNVNFELTLVNESNKNIEAKGSVVIEPLKLDMSINTKQFDLKPYNSYIKESLNLGIKSAYLSSDLKLKIVNEKNISKIKLNGNASLGKISIFNSKFNQKLFTIQNININKLAYTNDALKIKSIIINKPFLNVKINKDKSNNYSGISKNKDGKSKNSTTSEFTYLIQSITIKDGETNFTDSSLKNPYEMKMDKIQSEVSNISSNKNDVAKIKLQALIDGLSNFSVQGSFISADINLKTVIKTKLSNLDLEPLSLYGVKSIGNEIDIGKLFLTQEHRINKSQLISKNDIMIKDLKLGKDVESETAINAPIKLAIALLENSKGELNLSVPISGDINNPNFDLSSTVASIVTKTIVGIISSPFKILAALIGSKSDDLSKVEFAYGQSVIVKNQKNKLLIIIKAMKKRPGIKLKIINKSQKNKDIQALKTIKFDLSINNNQVYQDNKISKSELIKELYIKKYTIKEYETLVLKSKDVYFDMQKKLINAFTIKDSEFYNLMNARAINIKEYFLKNGLSSKRIKVTKYEELKNEEKNDLVVIELQVF